MIKYFLLIIAFLSSPLASAEKPSQHDHGRSEEHSASRQQAHLHGFATLTMALQANALEINMESPAASIVGFEHKASSEKNREAIKQAQSRLESSPRLFVFSGSDCTLKQANADMSVLIKQGSNPDDHHHDNEHNESHNEISVSYSYECSQGEKLDTISVNLIPLFPNIETIKVMWLTDNQQGATELTAKSNLIRIR
jgi:hypothetical protein